MVIKMLKQKEQLELNFSKYIELYDILIKPDNFWKQLNDMVNFSFVYEELKNKYSSTMGRTCEDIISMFISIIALPLFDAANVSSLFVIVIVSSSFHFI